MKQFVQTFESFYNEYSKYGKINEDKKVEGPDEESLAKYKDMISKGGLPVASFYSIFKFQKPESFWNFILRLKGSDFKKLTPFKNPVEFLINFSMHAGIKLEKKEFKNIDSVLVAEKSMFGLSSEDDIKTGFPLIATKLDGRELPEIKDNQTVDEYEIRAGLAVEGRRNFNVVNSLSAVFSSTSSASSYIGVCKFKELFNTDSKSSTALLTGSSDYNKKNIFADDTKNKNYTKVTKRFTIKDGMGALQKSAGIKPDLTTLVFALSDSLEKQTFTGLAQGVGFKKDDSGDFVFNNIASKSKSDQA